MWECQGGRSPRTGACEKAASENWGARCAGGARTSMESTHAHGGASTSMESTHVHGGSSPSRKELAVQGRARTSMESTHAHGRARTSMESTPSKGELARPWESSHVHGARAFAGSRLAPRPDVNIPHPQPPLLVYLHHQDLMFLLGLKGDLGRGVGVFCTFSPLISRRKINPHRRGVVGVFCTFSPLIS